ncbi:DUF418 domain-containing protein [Micromonospora sp. NPDC049559]|uniref:DUF418 domain-containing protein n=1 Tax=Micromonospora sp. NPDC049559 TaxID=3155923 RepID=UPI0034308DF9
MSETVRRPAAAGPAQPAATRQRYLAPDLARGTMLLIVALVHAHMFLAGSASVLRGYPPDGAGVDAVVAALLTVFADGRSYPMFSALFGYGLTQIALRQEASGWDWPKTRRLLRRRGRWLLVFGLLHLLLLFSGDILGTYGIIALVFVGLLRASDRRILRHSAVWFVLGSVTYGVMLFAAAAGPGPENSSALFMLDDPVQDALYRIATWPVGTPLFVVTSVCPFLVGVWAARRRVLEEPERHLVLLRRTALVGIAVTVLGGLPLALVTSGVWADPAPGPAIAVGILHTASGYAGGFGYAALVALVAWRIGTARGPVVTAVAACGQRSLSCYLLQSVAWIVLFAPYTVDLGSRIGVAASAVVGFGVWLGTVLVAELLRRLDSRGPAESLLRRLSYGAKPAA